MWYVVDGQAKENWRLFPGTGNCAWLSNVDESDSMLAVSSYCTVGTEEEDTEEDYHEFMSTENGTSSIGVALRNGNHNMILLFSFDTDIIEISEAGVQPFPKTYREKGIPKKYFKGELIHWIHSLTMNDLLRLINIKAVENYVTFACNKARNK